MTSGKREGKFHILIYSNKRGNWFYRDLSWGHNLYFSNKNEQPQNKCWQRVFQTLYKITMKICCANEKIKNYVNAMSLSMVGNVLT